MLELDDIQSGVLRPRPTPYVATYIALRIDDRQAGRALMQRISNAVTSAANPESPLADTWVSVALTYQGLKALFRCGSAPSSESSWKGHSASGAPLRQRPIILAASNSSSSEEFEFVLRKRRKSATR